MKNEEHGSSREPSHTASSPLDGVARSIRHHLDHDLKFKPTGRDPKSDGYAYAEVPDWALRQWLDRIEIAKNGISISGSEDGEAALVAEEQVAGESSREANETDWKARCEAAEQALEGMRKHLIWCANHADECLGDHPARLAEIMRVASVTPGRAALNPTPQGGKPDSEPEEDPCPGCGDGDKVPAKGYWRCPVCDAEWNDDSEEG